MFKNLYVLEVEAAEGRVYRLECQPGSPRGECYDALNTMMATVLEQMKQAAAKEAEEKCEEQGEEDAPASEV